MGSFSLWYSSRVNQSRVEFQMVATLRRGLLVVFLFGVVGTIVELFLLEHVDGWKQWMPIALLCAGGCAAAAAALHPVPWLMRCLQVASVLCVVSGGAGTWFHYVGNVEFEIERTPELGGLALFSAAMGGATPALAPGTMIQFGLIGLLFTWRHPGWRARETPPPS